MKTPWKLRAMLVAGTMGAVALHGMTAASATPSEESCFVSAINSARADAGVPALAGNGDLLNIARPWSDKMAGTGRIFHNTNLANMVPSNWMAIGENVGMGPTCDAIAQAFMNSPDHKRNILDPDFSTVGVGVVDAADGTIFVTEDFMGTGSAPAPNPKASPPPAPRPVETTPPPKPVPAPAPAAPPAGTETHAPAAAPQSITAKLPPVPVPAPAAPAALPAPVVTSAQPIVEVPVPQELYVQHAATGGNEAGPAPTPAIPLVEAQSRHEGLVKSLVSAIGSFFSHLF